MTKKKKLLIIISVIATVFLSFSILLVVYFPTISNILTTNTEKYPEPKITYGEFPFELTYMLNGEEITIKDVYVCEYAGAHWNWNQGHYREWKGYLKSNQNEDIVLLKDGNKEIIYSIGSPRYYMDDNGYAITTAGLVLVEHFETGGKSLSTLSDEMKEYYKIDLVSFDISDPIVNTFE